MQATMVLGTGVHAPRLGAKLLSAARNRVDRGTGAISVRNHPFQVDLEPPIGIPDVAKQVDRPIVERPIAVTVRDREIDETVTVIVGCSDAVGPPERSTTGISSVFVNDERAVAKILIEAIGNIERRAVAREVKIHVHVVVEVRRGHSAARRSLRYPHPAGRLSKAVHILQQHAVPERPCPPVCETDGSKVGHRLVRLNQNVHSATRVGTHRHVPLAGAGIVRNEQAHIHTGRVL